MSHQQQNAWTKKPQISEQKQNLSVINKNIQHGAKPSSTNLKFGNFEEDESPRKLNPSAMNFTPGYSSFPQQTYSPQYFGYPPQFYPNAFYGFRPPYRPPSGPVVVSSVSTATSSDKPNFEAPKKIAIKIVNPETKEEVKLQSEKSKDQELKQEETVVEENSATQPLVDETIDSANIDSKKASEPSESLDKTITESTKIAQKDEKIDVVPQPEKQVEPEQVEKITAESEEVQEENHNLDEVKKDEISADLEESEGLVEENQVSLENQPKETEVEPVKSSSGKKIYSKEFILSFQAICRDRPSNLPSIEIVIGEDNASRRSSKIVRGNRYSEARGKKSSGNFQYSNSYQGGTSRYSNVQRNSRGSKQQLRSSYHKMEKSENAWKPFSERKKEQTDHLELVLRKGRALLNKLTIEKFNAITAQIISLEVSSLNELTEFVGLIFEKAISESKYSEMYSRLCLIMSFHLTDFSEAEIEAMDEEEKGYVVEHGKKKLFRKCLINKCQKEFEREAEFANMVRESITDDMTEEEIKVITAKESERKKEKQRTLGNIRFIGELYKATLLPLHIVQKCISHLLSNPDEEDLESLCDLMSTVGKRIEENKETAEEMDSYFKQMEAYSRNTKYSSRVRFKIMDIIELRGRQWSERERKQALNSGPMKLDDVKKSVINIEKTQSSKPKPVVKKLQIQQKKEIKKKEDVSSSRNNSNESSGERSISKNMFDALIHTDVTETAVEASSPEKRKDVDSVELKKFMAKEMIVDIRRSCSLNPDESIEKSLATIMDLRSFVSVDKERETTVQAFKTLITEFCQEAHRYRSSKDSASKQRHRMTCINFGRLVATVVTKYNLKDDICAILEEQLNALDDLAIDVPGISDLVGFVYGRLIIEKVLNFDFACQCALKMVEDFAQDFTPLCIKPNVPVKTPQYACFFSCCMSSAIDKTEESILDATYMKWSKPSSILLDRFTYPWWGTDKSNLFKIPEGAISSWIVDEGLKRLDPTSETVVELFNFLNQEFQGKPLATADIEVVIEKFEKNEKNVENVTRILIKHIFNITRFKAKENSEEWETEESKAAAMLFPFLKPLLICKERSKMESVIIQTVQDWGNKEFLKNIPNYFLRIFKALVEQNVVSKDSFLKWEKDFSNASLKMEWLSRGGKSFFDWLSKH